MIAKMCLDMSIAEAYPYWSFRIAATDVQYAGIFVQQNLGT
jgi:hypothetical protein